MKTLILIDGHNFLFKSFGVPFTFYSSTGTPLHVVTTFLKFMRRSCSFMSQNDRLYLAVIFDTATKTANHALDPKYKANRKSVYAEKDHPFIHLPYIQKALANVQVPYFEIPYIEADDVIATLATTFKQDMQSQIFIASHDTDFYQLVDKQVKIIKHFPHDKTIYVDTTYIYAETGVYPSEYVYYKSLKGDSADNIKGIPLIGPVKARKIVRNEMYFNTGSFEKLIAKNIALISLDTHANIGINLESLVFDLKQLQRSNSDIFAKCDF